MKTYREFIVEAEDVTSIHKALTDRGYTKAKEKSTDRAKLSFYHAPDHVKDKDKDHPDDHIRVVEPHDKAIKPYWAQARHHLMSSVPDMKKTGKTAKSLHTHVNGERTKKLQNTIKRAQSYIRSGSDRKEYWQDVITHAEKELKESLHENGFAGYFVGARHFSDRTGAEKYAKSIGGVVTPSSNPDHKGFKPKDLGSKKIHTHMDDSPDSHRRRMGHSITAYDQKMSANPKAGWNHYALGHMLGAADKAHADMKKGMSPDKAINKHFMGPLADRLHRHLGTGGKYERQRV